MLQLLLLIIQCWQGRNMETNFELEFYGTPQKPPGGAGTPPQAVRIVPPDVSLCSLPQPVL